MEYSATERPQKEGDEPGTRHPDDWDLVRPSVVVIANLRFVIRGGRPGKLVLDVGDQSSKTLAGERILLGIGQSSDLGQTSLQLFTIAFRIHALSLRTVLRKTVNIVQPPSVFLSFEGRTAILRSNCQTSTSWPSTIFCAASMAASSSFAWIVEKSTKCPSGPTR